MCIILILDHLVNFSKFVKSKAKSRMHGLAYGRSETQCFFSISCALSLQCLFFLFLLKPKEND